MQRREFIRVGAAGAAALGRLPPLPLAADRPVPTPQQLRWQRDGLAVFAHFGINTFTDREWGDGSESPALFNPVELDARQWARAARAGGFRTLVLTAKHHDGFCLWPSKLTTHSVASSPWREGTGDVVREVVESCRVEGLGVGLYLSPWDRHEPSYGDSPRYNDFYCAQLEELLTAYGPVVEVWFDGANGEGPNGKRQEYDWPRIHRTVRRLRPDALIFSDAGPDIRWIGNERGVAGDPNWCPVDPAAVPVPGVSGPGVTRAMQHGDPDGTVWRPGEADVSIRPGWFWHPAEDARVRDAGDLVDLYFSSVGRNANLLLNVPPTKDGLFHETDVQRLAEFGGRLARLFAVDGAAGAKATATATRDRDHAPDRVTDGDPDTWWGPPDRQPVAAIELEFLSPQRFDVVLLEEAIADGQRVGYYRVEALTGEGWRTVSWGTTIGHRKLDRIAPVTARRLRLSILHAFAAPRIGRVAVYNSDGS